jgi:hypothetical protein
MGDEREMGRLEAKVELLLDLVQGLETKYVTKAEYEPRISALEQSRQNKWVVVASVGSLGSMIISAIALIRTVTLH